MCPIYLNEGAGLKIAYYCVCILYGFNFWLLVLCLVICWWHHVCVILFLWPCHAPSCSLGIRLGWSSPAQAPHYEYTDIPITSLHLCVPLIYRLHDDNTAMTLLRTYILCMLELIYGLPVPLKCSSMQIWFRNEKWNNKQPLTCFASCCCKNTILSQTLQYLQRMDRTMH